MLLPPPPPPVLLLLFLSSSSSSSLAPPRASCFPHRFRCSRKRRRRSILEFSWMLVEFWSRLPRAVLGAAVEGAAVELPPADGARWVEGDPPDLSWHVGFDGECLGDGDSLEPPHSVEAYSTGAALEPPPSVEAGSAESSMQSRRSTVVIHVPWGCARCPAWKAPICALVRLRTPLAVRPRRGMSAAATYDPKWSSMLPGSRPSWGDICHACRVP